MIVVSLINERRQMTRRKVLLTTALSTATLGIALAGSTFAANQTQTTAQTTRPQMTVEQREAHQAEREAAFTTALNTATTNGKITAEQKATLLAKHEAIQAKMESGDRSGAQTLIKEMHDWMVANKIDASVMPKPSGPRGNGNGNGNGNGLGEHRGNMGAHSFSTSNK
jgi:hypothetical protein